MILHPFRSESCLAYLLADRPGGSAALVDPRADQVPVYRAALAERGLTLVAVIETHTHADHLSGAAELRSSTGAEVYLSRAAISDVATRRVGDGDRIAVGGVSLEVLASPGHTDDSLSLLAGSVLLTGDALLIGGAGRTDFQNGSAAELHDTLHRRFAALPGSTEVRPAHDYAGREHSTLEEERRSNPLFALTDRDRFVAALEARSTPRPADMDAIVLANRIGVARLATVAPDALAGELGGAHPPLLVDVRLPFEHRSSHLPGSTLLPLGDLDRRKDSLPAGAELVLVCRTGSRARLAAAKLSGRNVRVLEGGLEAWRAAGHPLVEGQPHMSLERQVRVVAGSLAAAGGLLAVLVSAWWGLLPSFIGLGLVYAGVTDRCGMAALLGRLPWNQVEAEAAGGTCAAACAAPVARDPR